MAEITYAITSAEQCLRTMNAADALGINCRDLYDVVVDVNRQLTPGQRLVKIVFASIRLRVDTNDLYDAVRSINGGRPWPDTEVDG